MEIEAGTKGHLPANFMQHQEEWYNRVNIRPFRVETGLDVKGDLPLGRHLPLWLCMTVMMGSWTKSEQSEFRRDRLEEDDLHAYWIPSLYIFVVGDYTNLVPHFMYH